MLKIALAGAVLAATLTTAQAADSCTAQASARKLAGAARTSFLTKCQKDAAASCDATATTRKLAGAARTSFTKKCVTDAVGT